MQIENPFTGIDERPCAGCDAVVNGERGMLVAGTTDLGGRLDLADEEFGVLCGECVIELDRDVPEPT